MNLIVSVDQNWGIGKSGDQLIYIPEDLRHFRQLTLGKTVIFSEKTMKTFPNGKPLSGRRNIIISKRNLHIEGAEVYNSVEDILKQSEDNAFVIGGGLVYKSFLPYCDTAYVTKVRVSIPADTFFPDLDHSKDWKTIYVSQSHESNGIQFYFETYWREGKIA